MTETMITETQPSQAGELTPPASAMEQAPQQTSWFGSLGDDLKDNISLQKFQSVDGLAKSYLSLESMLGQEKIPVPKSDDDENAWAMYKKAFKVPDTPEAYELFLSDELGDFKEKVQDLSEIKKISHELKLSPSQAQALTNRYLGILKDAHTNESQQYEAQIREAENALKQEWGLAFESKLKSANNVAMQLMGDKESFEAFEAKYGNDPMIIKLLAKVADSTSEGSLGGIVNNSSGFAKSPAEASAEFNDILNNKANPKHDAYFNRDAAGHSEAVKYMATLMEAMG